MSAPSITSATSRTKIVGYAPVLIGTASRSFTFRGMEFSGTIGYLPAIIILPDGLIRLASVIAFTTSSGEILHECKRSGLILTTMVRALPPNGGGAETPGNVAKRGRTRL